LFWILALLLATIEFPDLGSTLHSMEQSLKRLADRTLPFETAAPDEAAMPESDATPVAEAPSTPIEQRD
jgi:hypothetical protein